jgi:hypothetical protein
MGDEYRPLEVRLCQALSREAVTDCTMFEGHGIMSISHLHSPFRHVVRYEFLEHSQLLRMHRQLRIQYLGPQQQRLVQPLLGAAIDNRKVRNARIRGDNRRRRYSAVLFRINTGQWVRTTYMPSQSHTPSPIQHQPQSPSPRPPPPPQQPHSIPPPHSSPTQSLRCVSTHYSLPTPCCCVDSPHPDLRPCQRPPSPAHTPPRPRQAPRVRARC